MNLMSFGEIIGDVYPHTKKIGGAPLNFAAHAARCGANVWLLSAVGDDVFGTEFLRKAESYGIRTETIATVAGSSPGICRVTLDENGVPSYAVAENCAYDAIEVPSLSEYASEPCGFSIF